MIQMILRILLGIALAALLIWSKWRMLKNVYSKNLGDGGIQTLFEKDSK